METETTTVVQFYERVSVEEGQIPSSFSFHSSSSSWGDRISLIDGAGTNEPRLIPIIHWIKYGGRVEGGGPSLRPSAALLPLQGGRGEQEES